MLRKLWPVVFAAGLSGCASLKDFNNVLFGYSAQKATRTPIWVYKPDLRFNVGGRDFTGMAVTALSTAELRITSEIDIDRVEISAFDRHDVCQNKQNLPCDNRRFALETGWFGSSGKKMTYHFIPSDLERKYKTVSLMISIYSKNSLAAWGYLILRDPSTDNLPAHMTCNGGDWQWAGRSVCSTKNGTLIGLDFKEPVAAYKADDSCHATQTGPLSYEFKPDIGWCFAEFGKGENFHRMTINGYDEVLLRGEK